MNIMYVSSRNVSSRHASHGGQVTRRSSLFSLFRRSSRVGTTTIQATQVHQREDSRNSKAKKPKISTLPLPHSTPALSGRSGMFQDDRSQSGHRFWWASSPVVSSSDRNNDETGNFDEFAVFYDGGECFGFNC